MARLINLDFGQADFEIRKDLRKLADMGEPISMLQWQQYADSNPSMARLVTKAVRIDAARSAAANATAGAFITKAEKRIGKKAKKAAKRARDRAIAADITKGRSFAVDPDVQEMWDVARQIAGNKAPNFGDIQVAAYRVALAKNMVRDELASPDPMRRKAAGA